MLSAGLEPARPNGRGILSPLCLPNFTSQAYLNFKVQKQLSCNTPYGTRTHVFSFAKVNSLAASSMM
jgi:hypothetical protein